jgi:UDP-glucose 4-epimerase
VAVRVLVSGGAGFIGSHLVDRLVGEGDELIVVDDFSHGRPDNIAEAVKTGQVATRELALLDDGLVAAVRQAAPEVVVHLAAQIDVRASVRDPLHDASTNILGTIAMLEAAHRAGVRKVVLASSVAIYGPPPVLPVTEVTPVNPLSPYAVSKLAGEYYLQQYQRLHGLETTTLVFTNTYGPRQDPHGEAGVVAIFLEQMITGAGTRVFGDGSNSRDYVYVDDVVDAIVRATGPAASGQRLVIGTGVATTDLELHRAVATVVGGAPEPDFAPSRLGDLPHMVVDASAARAVLGWQPRISLHEGLTRTAAAMRATLSAD